MFLATKNSCTNCLRVLLEAGADPDIGTKVEKFFLHLPYERLLDDCCAER